MPLTTKLNTLTGKSISSHVVVVSLPGFTFSLAPPANWTVDDTGRILNDRGDGILHLRNAWNRLGTVSSNLVPRLLSSRLGSYQGSQVGYFIYSSYNSTVRAIHFFFLPFLPPHHKRSLMPMSRCPLLKLLALIASCIGPRKDKLICKRRRPGYTLSSISDTHCWLKMLSLILWSRHLRCSCWPTDLDC